MSASWRRLVLGDMLARNARRFGAKAALVSGDVRLTYTQLNDRVNRLASALAGRGVRKGSKVAVMAYNSHRLVEAYFACNKLGAVVVPVNYRMVAAEVQYVLAHSDAEVLLFGEHFADVARATAVGTLIQMSEAAPAFALCYEALVAAGAPVEPDVDIDDDDDAFLMYTSGTTGFPKGALLTHKNLWVNTANWIIEIGISSDSVWTAGLPLFHIGGLNGVLPFFFIGGTVAFETGGTSFDPIRTLRLMSAEKVTHCNFVPTMWQQILDQDRSAYDLSSLRMAMWGASMAPLRLLDDMCRAFPGIEIVNAFGQTEMSSNTTFLRGKDAVRKMGSVGHPLVNVEVRVVDDQDRDVAPGEVGEIVYRGPTVLKEYYKDPAATAEAMSGGWFHSGDLVRADAEGYLYVVDRKKDMIISGGENIYPAEVERAIGAHPAVREVAVIGVADPKWVETPKAVVVVREGFTLTRDEVIEHCRKQMASYKKPSYVAFVRELPRNAAGKVLRRELRRLHGGADDQ